MGIYRWNDGSGGKFRVGDWVVVRGCFGADPPARVCVTGLELTAEPRCKYGEPVEEVSSADVRQNKVIFSYGNSWCYSEQVLVSAAK